MVPQKNEGKYYSLPIRVSFEASTGNFVQFMKLVDQQSGSLEEQDFKFGEPVRAMQIDRINLSFPNYDPENPLEEFTYNVNLQVSAFFTNPLLTQNKTMNQNFQKHRMPLSQEILHRLS